MWESIWGRGRRLSWGDFLGNGGDGYGKGWGLIWAVLDIGLGVGISLLLVNVCFFLCLWERGV